jgi:ADP-ribose pyrophosphatase YjhB (NUDIX family)
MTTLPMHHAYARILRLDQAGRVLLFLVDGESLGVADNHTWCAPGDMVRDAEAAAYVASRVVRRYFGLEIKPDELGSPVAATSEVVSTSDGTELRVSDSYFALMSSAGEDEPKDLGTFAEVGQARWWTAEEIETTGEAIVPAGLADLVRRLNAGEELTHPMRLPHRDAER